MIEPSQALSKSDPILRLTFIDCGPHLGGSVGAETVSRKPPHLLGVLESLGCVLEALGDVLEALGGVFWHHSYPNMDISPLQKKPEANNFFGRSQARQGGELGRLRSVLDASRERLDALRGIYSVE